MDEAFLRYAVSTTLPVGYYPSYIETCLADHQPRVEFGCLNQDLLPFPCIRLSFTDWKE